MTTLQAPSPSTTTAPVVRDRHRTPTDRVRAAYARDAEVARPELWITLRPEADALADATEVERRLTAGQQLPLAGVVVAVKDNVDVADLPTTAAHPAFARVPERSATAVQRLVDAGAVVLGKTNLDQFATGLTGARSPYGDVRSAVLPDRVAGGSSAGSAAAVAHGIVDVAVATDTAGSGRVPAAFNGVVGIKATFGLVPKDGVVPACPSYDCVTVVARTLTEATAALRVMTGPTPLDPQSRAWPADTRLAAPDDAVVAVPAASHLEALGPAARERFEAARRRLEDGGVASREIDLTPFLEAARLLYDGALVAERAASFGAFLAEHPHGADPSVATIAARAATLPAVDLVRDQQRLHVLRTEALAALGHAHALLLPTVPEHPTAAAVAADPLGVNARLGTFTNMVNLLDLAAVAVPTGPTGDGLTGATLVTRAFEDQVAIDLAALLLDEPPPEPYPSTGVPLVVFGAHLRGELRNWQLHELGGRFLREVRTAPAYRMHLAPDGLRPVVVPTPVGVPGIDLPGEEWLLSPAALGALLATIAAPLALGHVRLDDGREVLGFTGAVTGREPDISDPHGWRAFRARHA
jgi:allophanate hydrolase